MGWNDFAGMSLDGRGVHTTDERENGGDNRRELRMDDKEMPSVTACTETETTMGMDNTGEWTCSFVRVESELESTGSGRQRGPDGTR